MPDSNIVIVETYRSAACVLGHCENVLIAVFHDASSVQDIDAMDALNRSLVAKHPVVAQFSILTAMTKPPSAEVRARIASLMKTMGKSEAVLVVTAGGLSAAFFRGFMATLALVAPNVDAVRVAKTVADGVRAVEPGLSSLKAPRAELTSAIERFAARPTPAR